MTRSECLTNWTNSTATRRPFIASSGTLFLPKKIIKKTSVLCQGDARARRRSLHLERSLANDDDVCEMVDKAPKLFFYEFRMMNSGETNCYNSMWNDPFMIDSRNYGQYLFVSPSPASLPNVMPISILKFLANSSLPKKKKKQKHSDITSIFTDEWKHH